MKRIDLHYHLTEWLAQSGIKTEGARVFKLENFNGVDLETKRANVNAELFYLFWLYLSSSPKEGIQPVQFTEENDKFSEKRISDYFGNYVAINMKDNIAEVGLANEAQAKEDEEVDNDLESKINFLFENKLLKDIKFNIEVNLNASLMSYDMRESKEDINLQLPYIAACMMIVNWLKEIIKVNPQMNNEEFEKLLSFISEIETLRYNLWTTLYNDLTETAVV